jgi:hypothetical protein
MNCEGEKTSSDTQNIPVALMEVFTYNLLFQYKDENKKNSHLNFAKCDDCCMCHFVEI